MEKIFSALELAIEKEKEYFIKYNKSVEPATRANTKDKYTKWKNVMETLLQEISEKGYIPIIYVNSSDELYTGFEIKEYDKTTDTVKIVYCSE